MTSQDEGPLAFSRPDSGRLRSADAGAVIGVDIGGTSISLDIVDRSGRNRFRSRCPTGHGEEAVAALLDQLAVGFAAARSEGLPVLGVGVLSPGHVDPDRGLVHFASNLGWRDLPLGERVRAVLPDGTPFLLGHDVRWAGIAEGALGAARGVGDYVMVSIGTGIAACLVSGGHVLRGAEGSAGEFGHATVIPDGERCACGRIGCVDAYASAAALIRRYREAGGRAELDSAAAILQACATDPLARQVWDEGVEALAAGLCSLTLTIDPSVIIIAGGLSAAGAALIDPLRGHLERQLGWKRRPRLEISPLGPSTGRAGAVLAALTAGDQRDAVENWDARTVNAWGPVSEREVAPV